MKRRFETEIKLPVRDRKQVEKRLAQLGFKVFKARHLESNYLFDFPDFRLGRSGCLLRLRFAPRENLLTFKGPPLRTRRYASRREIETRIEEGAVLREVFEKLDLKQVFVYEKFRTIFAEGARGNIHELPQVAYDETPVGNYLELEGPAKWIDRVASRLGYSPQDYITSTYLALYLGWCCERGRKPGNMVFRAVGRGSPPLARGAGCGNPGQARSGGAVSGTLALAPSSGIMAGGGSSAAGSRSHQRGPEKLNKPSIKSQLGFVAT